jgi:hypothetical protein
VAPNIPESILSLAMALEWPPSQRWCRTAWPETTLVSCDICGTHVGDETVRGIQKDK